MDIIELFIDEEDNVSGIDAISIVENPAIQVGLCLPKKSRV